MFNKLPCKVRFHIAVRSLSKCSKSIWFHLNTFLKSAQNQKTFAKSAVFYRSFFGENGLENSREIPTKSAVFSREFVPENPAKFDSFLPRPTRSLSSWRCLDQSSCSLPPNSVHLFLKNFAHVLLTVCQLLAINIQNNWSASRPSWPALTASWWKSSKLLAEPNSTMYRTSGKLTPILSAVEAMATRFTGSILLKWK